MSDKLPEGATEHILYGGDVQLVFNPNSPRYRYTVTDKQTGLKDQSVRGVTTVLRDIINKPDLMTWPMNMAQGYLFGSTFNEETKKYLYDEKKALLKPGKALDVAELQSAMENASAAFRAKQDKGKDVGTMTHKMIEQFLKGEAPDLTKFIPVEGIPGFDEDMKLFEVNSKMAIKAFERFKEWWNSLEQKEVMSTERPVYSRMMGYGGTCDLVAEINGKIYMLDIKTTNTSKKAPLGIYAQDIMQLGAYAHACREEDGTDFDDLGIIRVSKEGQLSIATAGDMGIPTNECERAFAFAVRVHDWLEKTTPFLADAHFNSHLVGPIKEGRESDSKNK